MALRPTRARVAAYIAADVRQRRRILSKLLTAGAEVARRAKAAEKLHLAEAALAAVQGQSHG